MSAPPVVTAQAAPLPAGAPPGRSAGSLPDASARQRIAADLDTTLVVEAAAGTGKTTALVSRMVELVRSGRANLAGVAAITFTQRAAGDLRLRIRQGLEAEIARGAAPAEARRMEEAMSALEEASIGTIHAFCSTLLRERPLPAGVDPDFGILTGGEQAAFFEPLFREYLRRQLEDPAPGVARLLRRNRDSRADPVRSLRSAAFRLLEHRDLDAPWSRPKRDAEEAVRRLLYEDELGEDETAITGACLSTLAGVHRLLPPETPGQRPNWLHRSIADAAELERDISIRKETGRWDHDWVEQALAALQLREYGGRRPDRDTVSKLLRAFPLLPVEVVGQAMQVDLNEVRDGFLARLEAFREEVGADLAALLREELRPLLGKYERTAGGGDPETEAPDRNGAAEAGDGAEKALTTYEEAKRTAGRLDFEDLLLRTRDLLRDDPGAREELRTRFTHILVDEYQDTDPVQTEILFLLTAADPPEGDWRRAVPTPGRLFLVGDPKQSIYRFRRADVRHYLQVKEHLLAHGAAEVRLTTNFRSVPEICEFVNGVFEPLFGAAGGGRAPDGTRPAGEAESGDPFDGSDEEEDPEVRQVEYAPIEARRSPLGNRAALAAIPVPDGGGLARNAREIERAEPAAVARFVHGLLKSGFEVSDRAVARRPVEPSDICLLFRRFRAFGRLIPQAYADALQRRDIPQALAAIPSYTSSTEIRAMRAALTAVEYPDDELQVYATLRGPLFAFSDEELFLYRERGGRLCPGAPGPPPEAPSPQPENANRPDDAIRDSLDFLDELHRERNRRPVSRTIQDLLSRHRAETAFAFRKSADQVLANLRRLTQSAREFEADGGLSFRAFVRRLDDEANDADYGATHAFDPDVRGVRFSTVHSAKGLEFPVVILVDTPCERKGRAQRVVRPKERLHACDLGDGIRPLELLKARKVEEQEDVLETDRTLYVAATRARDLLVTVRPSAQYEMDRSWLRPVYDRMPEPDDRSGGRAAETADETSGMRTADSRPTDPTARRWSLLARGADSDPGDGGFNAFLEQRADTLARGSVPTQSVTRTDRYARRDFSPDEVTIHELPRAPSRPGGAAFGELVHRILERAPLDGAEADAPARLAPLLAAEFDLDEALAAPAAAAVEAALDHEVLRSARRAAERGACYREFPIYLREDDPAPEEPGAGKDTETNDAETNGALLIEGKVDLLFRTEDDTRWMVVEFKTGRELADAATSPEAEAALDRYRRQATIYARAVSRATGEPARPVLLFL